MSKKGRDDCFKCAYCGKYIAYKDIGTSKIKHEYIPDSEYSTESDTFWHTACEIKYKKNSTHNKEV